MVENPSLQLLMSKWQGIAPLCNPADILLGDLAILNNALCDGWQKAVQYK